MSYDVQTILSEIRTNEYEQKIDLMEATHEICEKYSDIFQDPEYKQFVNERAQILYMLSSINPEYIQEATFAPSINTAQDLQDMMYKIEHCNAPSKTSFIVFKICIDALAYGSTAIGGYQALFGKYDGFSLLDRIRTFSLAFFIQHVIKYGAPFLLTLYNWVRRIFNMDTKLSYDEKIRMLRLASKAIDDAIVKISTNKVNPDPSNARVTYALNLPVLQNLKIEIEKEIREYEDWKSGALRGVLKYGY